MQNRKPDRRVQRTRQMLNTAMMELVMERGYDAVDVQTICERANLARATFYLHYRDKEQLLIECMEAIVAEFIERFREIPTEEWALADGAPVQQVFEYAREQAALYRMIMSGEGGMKVSKRLHELIASNTRAVLETQIEERNLTPQLPMDFICNYFAGSLLSLVYWWLESDMPYPAEEMVRMFRQISQYGRAQALGIG